MQPLRSRLNNAGSGQFYTDKWVTTVENNLTYIREHATTERREVSPEIQSKYLRDPNTMFLLLGIPRQLHNVVMRCMGWSKQEDYKEMFEFLYVPQSETIDRLRSLSRITL